MYCVFLAVDGAPGPGRWQDRVTGTVVENAELGRHTTYGVGGPARWLVVPASAADVKEAFASRERVFVMGAGSNILAADAGFDGVVLKVSGALGYLSAAPGETVVGAGRAVASLVKTCGEMGLAGMEWAAGIPGTVGGAVCTNAGAFGGAIWERVKYVDLVTAAGEESRLGPGDVTAGYRRVDFPVPKPFAVTAVTLELTAGEPHRVAALAEEYRVRRRASQPVGEASAGCVFKNPPDGPAAGALIDRAGLKGSRRGAAVVSSKHANFIVNEGGASARDIYELIAAVRRKVRDEFGVELELEIELLGEFDIE